MQQAEFNSLLLNSQAEFTTLLLNALQQNSVINALRAGWEKKVNDLEDENAQLKERVAELEQCLDETDQYAKRNLLLVHNQWEEKAGENTDQLIVGMAKNLGIHITDMDIERSHRTGRDPKPGKPRPVIVRFQSYKVRRQFYDARKRLKDNPVYSKTFINEVLTSTRNKMAKAARDLRRQKRIDSTFTTDGRVVIRTHDGNLHFLSTPQALDELIRRLPPVSASQTGVDNVPKRATRSTSRTQ
jgi:hypothetical protein